MLPRSTSRPTQCRAQRPAPQPAHAPKRARNHAAPTAAAHKALPLVAAALALVTIVLVAVPAVVNLINPPGKNLTSTSGEGQTVQTFKTGSEGPAPRLASALASASGQASNPPRYLNIGTTKTGEGRVTFSAVGDNLFNANLLQIADAAEGTVGDGAYAFDGFYREIKDTIAGYDISFVNQETTLGGTDRFGFNGYPSYNTPDALAVTMAGVGWDVVATNSNHTYDTWVPSIEHAQGVWNGYRDQLLTIGSFTSENDRRAPRVVACNGLRVAFLSYSYGQNGYAQADLPNAYYAVPYDAEVMRADVARSHQFADAVVVYLHAGTEYTHEADETQRTWSQECVDAGADLVIGSHAHVIQPMEWLTAPDGEQTLVVYGLGDFLSGYHNAPETILSGMFTCTFERVEDEPEGFWERLFGGSSSDEGSRGESGEDSGPDSSSSRAVRVTNVAWVPLIEHWENGDSTVRLVKGYTDEEARRNELLAGLDDPLGWIRQTTVDVIGSGFTIDM